VSNYYKILSGFTTLATLATCDRVRQVRQGTVLRCRTHWKLYLYLSPYALTSRTDAPVVSLISLINSIRIFYPYSYFRLSKTPQPASQPDKYTGW